MSIEKAIERAFDLARKKKYPKFYIAVDLHDTITQSSYNADKPYLDFYEKAKEVLQYLSSKEEIVLILFTSSYKENVEKILDWFVSNGINFQYFNENPECDNTQFGDFSKKFYYSIMFDDKAGFDPYEDWEIVKNKFVEEFDKFEKEK